MSFRSSHISPPTQPTAVPKRRWDYTALCAALIAASGVSAMLLVLTISIIAGGGVTAYGAKPAVVVTKTLIPERISITVEDGMVQEHIMPEEHLILASGEGVTPASLKVSPSTFQKLSEGAPICVDGVKVLAATACGGA